MIISSTGNPQIKAIRKLRDRKYREETNTFYIEGIRIVREVISDPQRIKTLIVSPELLQSDSAAAALKEIIGKGIPVLEVSQSVFASFALKDHPQGLAAIVRPVWNSLADLDVHSMGLWVGLDSVADPGNLGTIMRTLDAVSAKGIFLIDACTDPYDPAAVRGSMGALFSLDLVKVTTEELIRWKKVNSVFACGTSDGAHANYQEVDYPANMILLMGSERQGLHPELASCCDEMVAIPMAGRSDSLNLAVATGVMLYEIYNQHRKRRCDCFVGRDR